MVHFENKTERFVLQVGRFGISTRCSHPKLVPNNLQPEDLFLLKTFIFSQLPSDYSFSVTEQLHGQIQTIDISSDIDGELHDVARSEVTTYGLYQSCEQ